MKVHLFLFAAFAIFNVVLLSASLSLSTAPITIASSYSFQSLAWANNNICLVVGVLNIPISTGGILALSLDRGETFITMKTSYPMRDVTSFIKNNDSYSFVAVGSVGTIYVVSNISLYSYAAAVASSSSSSYLSLRTSMYLPLSSSSSTSVNFRGVSCVYPSPSPASSTSPFCYVVGSEGFIAVFRSPSSSFRILL